MEWDGVGGVGWSWESGVAVWIRLGVGVWSREDGDERVKSEFIVGGLEFGVGGFLSVLLIRGILTGVFR